MGERLPPAGAARHSPEGAPCEARMITTEFGPEGRLDAKAYASDAGRVRWMQATASAA
jgi:hypothetical protein